MGKYFIFLFLSVLIIGCNSNSSQTEKDYIENLEKKNAALERELKEVNDNSPNHLKNSPRKSKDYFTIGSTEDEVIDVMGDPTTYQSIGSDYKILGYGRSSVSFYQGKVDSYINIEDNLKVKVR